MIALSRVWKLYFIYTILLVAGVALAGFVLEAQVKKSLLEHLEEDALTLAKVMALSMPESEDPSVLDRFCDSLRKFAGVRITLLDIEARSARSSPKRRREQHAFQQDLEDGYALHGGLFEGERENHSACRAHEQGEGFQE
jgi:hypothetical protein